MEKRILFIVGAVALITSCSNDSDWFPVCNDDCSWESSLDEIVMDNKDIFAYHDIEITDVKLLKDFRIDSALFFGGDYGYFPVFTKKDSVLEVIKYEDIDRQNKEYSFNKQVVNNKITTLLEKADDYDVIQLTWRYGTDIFKSLALFNKRTGELEYDNMLFNMTTIDKYDSEKFILIMRSSETPQAYYSGSSSVSYSEGNSGTLAYASVSWQVWAHWNTYTHEVDDDDDYYYYITYYTFCYDSARITESKWRQPDYDYFVMSCNNNVVYQPRFEILYAIWAGPLHGFNSTNFNLQLMTNDLMQERISGGNGVFVKIQEAPKREPTTFQIPKH